MNLINHFFPYSYLNFLSSGRNKMALVVFLSVTFCSSVDAQKSVFTDIRDGETYGIVEIGNLYWFSNNLKYKSKGSFCFDNPNNQKCANNNYYYNTNLDSICPSGWRIPTWKEWQQATYSFVEKNNLPRDVVKLDSSDLNRFSVTVSGVNLYKDSLGLNLMPAGWVEGNKIEKEKKLEKRPASTFWVSDPETNDPTIHIHVGSKSYLKHGHDHHINDHARRTRRFTVRCVKEKN